MSKITIKQVIVSGGFVGGIIGGSIGMANLAFQIIDEYKQKFSSSSKKEKLMKLANPLIFTIYGTIVGTGVVMSLIGTMFIANMPFFLIKTIFRTMQKK